LYHQEEDSQASAAFQLLYKVLRNLTEQTGQELLALNLSNDHAERVLVRVAEKKAIINTLRMLITLPEYLDQLQKEFDEQKEMREKIKKNQEGGIL
jgi:thioredoxin-related protein